MKLIGYCNINTLDLLRYKCVHQLNEPSNDINISEVILDKIKNLKEVIFGLIAEWLVLHQETVFVKEAGGTMMLLDGFDKALLGYTEVDGKNLAVYSEEKIISILMKEQGWSEEDAIEYYDYNILGLSGNKSAPLFVSKF